MIGESSIMDNPGDEQDMDSINSDGSDNEKACNTLTLENDVLKSEDSTMTPNPLKSTITPTNSKNFEISICKNHKISICKALIPLKLTLFLYYGAGSFMVSFVMLLYKQRGISLSQLSLMTITTPAFQFLGTTVSGIIADKLGKAKPVFVVNLLLTMSFVSGIMVLPNMSSTNREMQLINLTCNGKEVEAFTSCEAMKKTIEVDFCEGYCQDALKDQCSDKQIDCGKFDYSAELNMSFLVNVIDAFASISNGSCHFNVTPVWKGNSSYSWCFNDDEEYCALSCTGYIKTTVGASSLVTVAYFVLYVAFLTTFSNCYRTLDVTSMFLVKEHNSTFGHERFFGMLGNVLISPLAGYIADVTTRPGGERNYASAVYLYVGINLLLLPILYKLQVKVKPPGEKMWKKSLILLRNPDVLSFFIIILFLGTAWNFSKLITSWFLDELNANSMLIGLLISVGALYSLPFLLTSHWWVKKIGTSRVFILALLAHTIHSVGYSLLQNPWFSLLLESTGIMSYYIFWVALMEHCHSIAPEGLTATIIALAGALHFSAGKVASGMMGQFIMNHYGGRTAFRVSALMTLTAAILYAFYLLIRRKCLKAKHKLNQTEELNSKAEGVYTVNMKDLTH